MARKLYIFGIGGTGSRVIKAFTFLLASGVKLSKEFDTVIPIIIDPDISNGDLNRTKTILKLYQEIQNEIHKPYKFFSQKLKTINELTDNSSDVNPEYYHFKLEGVEDNTFGEYIGFNSLSSNFKDEKDDKSFIKLLYSDKNLQSKLDVGFKGHPNMGTVVLNQFTTSENFNNFANTFADGDVIFIINSIFGGTGAAGYPLLLKNLRSNNKDIPRIDKIRIAPIGAFTMLPYFALDNKDEIDAESFEQKTVSAIDYYNRTILKQNQIDIQYFIGNKGNTNFEEYSVGGVGQKNRAHFFELVGALSIFNFTKHITDVIENNEDNEYQRSNTKVREFGINEFNENGIIFQNLDTESRELFAFHLTKLKLFSEYLDKRLYKALGKARWTKGKGKFMQLIKAQKNKYSPLDKEYFNSPEYKNQVKNFLNFFEEWLSEMESNNPAFAPFNEIKDDNAFDIIVGNELSDKKGFEIVDTINNELIEEQDIRNTNDLKHSTLIKLFDKSLDRALKENNILTKKQN
ncbi:MAG: hypothetical protein GXO49_01005 [Chlorobi bacterium]|nr:hypothetical protein [Chlorobiota bacterium]